MVASAATNVYRPKPSHIKKHQVLSSLWLGHLLLAAVSSISVHDLKYLEMGVY